MRAATRKLATRGARGRWFGGIGAAAPSPTLLVSARRAPTLTVEDLPRQKVVLDSELLNFKVRAGDDFGVRRVGMEWQGLDPKVVKSIATGERVLAAGGFDKETLEVAGTFSAKSFAIEPQPIALRIFVEDYLPGRPRVVSPVYTLYILTAEQHAIWLTEQLSKWHRQSLEVRDRELQLYETNKQLRELTPEELDRADTRKRLEAQASAERVARDVNVAGRIDCDRTAEVIRCGPKLPHPIGQAGQRGADRARLRRLNGRGRRRLVHRQSRGGQGLVVPDRRDPDGPGPQAPPKPGAPRVRRDRFASVILDRSRGSGGVRRPARALRTAPDRASRHDLDLS